MHNRNISAEDLADYQYSYLSTSLQDKIPHFAGLFSFLQDTPPPSFKTHQKIIGSTPQTLNFIILYQNARHKFCRTLSRICRTAGYLRQQSYSLLICVQHPAGQSRTVGNYEYCTFTQKVNLHKEYKNEFLSK